MVRNDLSCRRPRKRQSYSTVSTSIAANRNAVTKTLDSFVPKTTPGVLLYLILIATITPAPSCQSFTPHRFMNYYYPPRPRSFDGTSSSTTLLSEKNSENDQKFDQPDDLLDFDDMDDSFVLDRLFQEDDDTNMPPWEDLEQGLEELLMDFETNNLQQELQKIQFQQESRNFQQLEQVLKEGVVSVTANVGSECLPGDFNFDPLQLSQYDVFSRFHNSEESLSSSSPVTPRPRALILRDYREAEIRHGRLAMLAAVFWPLQEMLDGLLLDDGPQPLVYATVTLPYFPLLMTAIMMLLGYQDVYTQERKKVEDVGDAYLPGDCFYDPLCMLEGAPYSMKRNMQERELFNGRVAMLAFVVYLWEELVTRTALIEIEGNDLLFEPAYQVPFIQKWLDSVFTETDPESLFFTPLNVAFSWPAAIVETMHYYF